MPFRSCALRPILLLLAQAALPGSAFGLTTHQVAGLNPFASYDVRRDGATLHSQITASEAGTLAFAADGAGFFEIALSGAQDVTPPAAVTDLTATGPSPTALTLHWTAPGDDGLVGRASRYDLRFSTTPITAGSFPLATPLFGVPFPGPPLSAESFVAGGLQSGTTYYFALKTRDEAGNWSALSNVASGTTTTPPPPADTTPPAAVTDLAAGSPTPTSLRLTWTAPGDDGSSGQAQIYDLRRSIEPIHAANFSQATPVSDLPAPRPAGSAESFTVSELQPGTTYYFALKTGDEAGNWSALSNLASASTTTPPPPPDTLPPSRVTDLATHDPTETALTLTWTAPGDDGMAGRAQLYDLRMSPQEIDSTSFALATPVPGLAEPREAGSSESFTVTGLLASTTYHFALKSRDEAGNWSALSNVPAGTTQSALPPPPPPPPPPPDTIPPGAVNDLAAIEPSISSLRLRWTAPGDDGHSGQALLYELRISTEPIDSLNFAQALVAGELSPQPAGSAESYTVTGLLSATTYFAALKTRDEAGNWSPISNVAEGTTAAAPPPPPPPPPQDTTPPAAVIDLAVSSAEETSLVLQWQAPGDDGWTGRAAQYDLRRSETPITPQSWSEALPLSGLPDPLEAGHLETFVVTGLSPGATYYFAIRTADEVPNWSDLSNLASGATRGSGQDTVAPAAVTDLVVGETADSSLSVFWTAPGDDGLVGRAALYDLRYSTRPISPDSFAHAVSVSDLPAPAPSGSLQGAVVRGLLPSTRYHLALKTRDEAGNWSDLSNPASAMTADPLPPPPPDLEPPGAVQDLLPISPTETSLTLRWTAPGDDGATGAAAVYDLRFSLTPMSAESWEAAVQVRGEPHPSPAGALEFCTAGDLEPGRTYYFALRSLDESGNASELSNIAIGSTLTSQSPDDRVPPSPVNDLTVLETESRAATLVWTAPGDDESVGTAAAYEVRRAASPVTPLNWALSIPVPFPSVPRRAGLAETLRVEGLAPNTTYFFGLRAIDDAGNAGAVSNSPPARTRAVPDTLPPAPIDDLVVIDSTESRLTFRWTTPADRLPEGAEGSGAIAEYEVRSHEGGEAAFDWTTASPVDPPPIPSAGTFTYLTLDGLLPATTYSISVRARDDSGNWSEPAAVREARTRSAEEPPPPPPPPPADTLAPDPVTTLAAYAPEPSVARLTWRATGDDGDAGTAARYELRWSPVPFSAADWDGLDSLAGAPAPSEPGTWESYDWPGREPGATYHFALRVRDETGNISALSNLAALVMPLPGDEAPPSPPSDPRVDWEDDSAVVRWDPSPDADVAGYRVYRRRADRAEPQILVPLWPATGWRDSDVVPGLVYAYSLQALDRSGNLSTRTREALFLVPVRTDGGPTPLVRRIDILGADPPSLRWPHVRLRWQVEGNRPLAGYLVYREPIESAPSPSARSEDPGELTRLTADALRGEGLFEYEDAAPLEPGNYRYWIEVLAAGDEPSQWLDPLPVRVDPWGAAELAVVPNPTPGPVRVLYTRASAGETQIRLFDASGRLRAVRTRADGAGPQAWELAGLGEEPEALSHGVFFFLLQADGPVRHGRVVILRKR